MRSRRAERVLTVGAVLAALTGASAGTAAAAPPAGSGITVTNDDYGLAALSSAERPDLTVFLDVFGTAGRSPFADLEVFVADHECVTGEEDSIPATVSILGSAATAGTLPLTCSSPTSEFPGQAVVEDVVWTAEGAPRFDVIPPGPGVRCVLFVVARDATVTGTVRVTVPGLGVDAEATGTRGELRHVTGLCPPEHG